MAQQINISVKAEDQSRVLRTHTVGAENRPEADFCMYVPLHIHM